MLNFSTNRRLINSLLFFLFIIVYISVPLTFLSENKILSIQNVLLLSRLKIWLGVFFLFLYTQKIEKSDFLLWKEKSYSAVHYVASVISTYFIIAFCMLILGLTLHLFGAKLQSDTLLKLMNIFKKAHWLIPVVCITAGVTEELLFRGYLMPRLEMLFNNSKLSIVVSSLLFGLMHFGYGTFAQIIGPFIIGLIFAIHYYKFRNIKIVMIVHFLWDFISLYAKLKFS